MQTRRKKILTFLGRDKSPTPTLRGFAPKKEAELNSALQNQ